MCNVHLSEVLVAHQMVLKGIVQALYVNNSINGFMCGLLDLEEGHGFEILMHCKVW